ncbi:MAG TPA: DUF308 domain-containing protein [Acidimicrobiales bacterium]|nr:DUF308 domain-containing protein [Acidimicrobiales bacterium]
MVDSASAQDPLDPVLSIGRHWGWLLFFGIVTLVLGILITVRPVDTVYAVAILLGIWLLIAGVFRMVASIATRDVEGGTRFLGILFGLLAVLIGLLVLHRSFETIKIVGFLIGIFWVIGGIVELLTAFGSPERPHRVWIAIAGLIGLVVGILALVYPGLSLVIIALLSGIWLIIYGCLQIAVSLTLRTASKS